MNQKAIIYTSYHHNNTINLLKDAVNELEYDWHNLLRDKEELIDLSKYDTIIFGSGIYYSKVHKMMIRFLEEKKEELKEKKIGIVITAGMNPKGYQRRVSNYFKKLDLENVLMFSCIGFDTYGPLKLIGGVNRNRPNQDDVVKLQEFLLKNNL
ncbi:MAG: flavodoxin domain-containing protein [Acholeplasmataceae bacterium]|jgi:menaquinone-dependent protoporphyrinogen IX oxidase